MAHCAKPYKLVALPSWMEGTFQDKLSYLN